jgi:hypothetical protein
MYDMSSRHDCTKMKRKIVFFSKKKVPGVFSAGATGVCDRETMLFMHSRRRVPCLCVLGRGAPWGNWRGGVMGGVGGKM